VEGEHRRRDALRPDEGAAEAGDRDDGRSGTDPNALVGTYVAPGDWNDLIAAPDVAVIDTRNDYETAIGTFRARSIRGPRVSAISPRGGRQNRDRFHNKRIAMFCTGGIRCEKSTAYLKAQGVEEVYHLKGGILKYLEEVPEHQSLWQGGCFVFDERVAVGHGLANCRSRCAGRAGGR
jgi:UPF0176 protein